MIERIGVLTDGQMLAGPEQEALGKVLGYVETDGNRIRGFAADIGDLEGMEA